MLLVLFLLVLSSLMMLLLLLLLIDDCVLCSVEYPKTADEVPSISQDQHLIFNFKLKNQASGKSLRAQQVFLRLANKKTGREVFSIARHTGKHYTAHIVSSYFDLS